MKKIKKTIVLSVCTLLLISWVTSCTQVDIVMPKGPKGDTGLSAYEFWKEKVADGTIQWPKDQVEVSDYLVYIKGEKGDSGENGKSAYELWKELIAGGTVTNPHNPSEKWPASSNSETDFWNFITGRDGVSPHIGTDGNWWIGATNTGIAAKGVDGLSAYELWKKEVLSDQIVWPKTEVDMSDFFRYLKGQDGISPHIGTDGNWWIGTTNTGVKAQGADGKTPYIQNGNWWIDGTDTGVKAQGEDGKTPYIQNGNWWIGTTDTGVKAQGADGKTPYIQNGNWWIDGTDTGVKAQGENGISPHIGIDGNWWIGTTNTGVKAQGADGKTPYIQNGNWWIGTTDTGVKAQGENGISPHIGTDGNWWIGTTNTGVKAQGPNGKSAYELWLTDLNAGRITNPHTGNPWPVTENTQADFWKYLSGKDGENGKSAYELWKEMVEAGNVPNPHNPTEMWPTNKTAINNFYEYLTGKDGENGESAYELWVKEVLTGTLEDPHNPGQYWNTANISTAHFWQFLRGPKGSDGIDGQDGEPGTTVLLGMPNVLPVFYNGQLREYVNPEDGSVMFQVFNATGAKVSAGIKVKGLPGSLVPNYEYTTDANGKITVPREHLPDKLSLPSRSGKSQVNLGSGYVDSAPNTMLPNRINTRIVMKTARLYGLPGLNTAATANWTTIVFANEREVDGTWGTYPVGLPATTVKAAEIVNHTATLNDANLTFNTHWQRAEWSFTDSVKIARATVLTPLEEAHLIDRRYRWDGTDKYFTVRGETNYYGEKPVMPAAVLVPEINPYPSIENVKMYIAQGQTNMWGRIRMQDLSYYFDLQYPVSTTTNPTVANPAIWKPTKHQASELPSTFRVLVRVNAVQTGSTVSTFKYREKSKPNFLLIGAYPMSDDNTSIYTSEGSGPGFYRAMRIYRYVVKDAGSANPTYWLRNGFGSANPAYVTSYPDIPVPIDSNVPANWEEQP